MAVPQTHIFVIRGGVFGWDGPTTSFGIDTLYRAIRSATPSWCTASIWNWSNETGIRDAERNLPLSTHVMFVGYSGGGWIAAEVARTISRTTDLLVGLDPSPWWKVNPIWLQLKVRKAICYWNRAPNLGSFGGAKYSGYHVDLRPIAQQHLAVQFDTALRARVLTDIEKELLNVKSQLPPAVA